MRQCKNCKDEYTGRIDKIFCSTYCKTAFHYQKQKANKDSLYVSIDKQLKTNRRLLKFYNKAGKSYVPVQVLLEAGFDPNYFTHYWKNQKGDVYLFCYEYGFFKRKEKTADKYVLIKWQSYMSKLK